MVPASRPAARAAACWRRAGRAAGAAGCWLSGGLQQWRDEAARMASQQGARRRRRSDRAATMQGRPAQLDDSAWRRAPVQAALASGDRAAAAARDRRRAGRTSSTVEDLGRPTCEALYAALPRSRLRQAGARRSGAGRRQAGGARGASDGEQAGSAWPRRRRRWRCAYVASAVAAADREPDRGRGAAPTPTSRCARAATACCERGDSSLARWRRSRWRAEVPDSDLRIAAALPDRDAGAVRAGRDCRPGCGAGCCCCCAAGRCGSRAAPAPARARSRRRSTTARCAHTLARRCSASRCRAGLAAPPRDTATAAAAVAAGGDRPRHLPRLRHPRRGRADARRERRRTDRPGDRLADARRRA